MFIQTQDRKSIINTFAVKKFVVTPENQIQAIIELPTKTKPAVIEVLAEYDSDEKRKAVMKALMFEMRRREQAFKMPKNHKVNLNPAPPKDKKPQKPQQAPAPAAAPAAEAPADAPAADAPDKE
ncbi:MAG: hypothetical protein IJ668_01835 [Selenomonadaceae bacterium]|nr:hypothetical protein [Selenomonadaceae bacterium]